MARRRTSGRYPGDEQGKHWKVRLAAICMVRLYEASMPMRRVGKATGVGGNGNPSNDMQHSPPLLSI